MSVGNVSLEKSLKVFLNLLDSNSTNIVSDIFIFLTPSHEKVLTLQKPVQILKKKSKY